MAMKTAPSTLVVIQFPARGMTVTVLWPLWLTYSVRDCMTVHSQEIASFHPTHKLHCYTVVIHMVSQSQSYTQINFASLNQPEMNGSWRKGTK